MEKIRTLVNPRPGTDAFTVLFAGESVTFPNHDVGPQILDYYLIHYVLAGKGTFRSRGTQYDLSAGESFFIYPGEIISYTSDSDEPWRYRWVALQGHDVPRLMADLDVSPDHPIASPNNSRRAAAVYRQLIACLEEGGAQCGLQSAAYAMLILSEFVRKAEPVADSAHADGSVARRQVEQAIRYLTLQYYQPISIEQIAREMGYHRTHFCKIFKQFAGISPYQFLTKIRMTQAARLLNKSLSIQQVASAVGYNDPLYFSKQFRKYFGMPPSRYPGGGTGKQTPHPA